MIAIFFFFGDSPSCVTADGPHRQKRRETTWRKSSWTTRGSCSTCCRRTWPNTSSCPTPGTWWASADTFGAGSTVGGASHLFESHRSGHKTWWLDIRRGKRNFWGRIWLLAEMDGKCHKFTQGPESAGPPEAPILCSGGCMWVRKEVSGTLLSRPEQPWTKKRLPLVPLG